MRHATLLRTLDFPTPLFHACSLRAFVLQLHMHRDWTNVANCNGQSETVARNSIEDWIKIRARLLKYLGRSSTIYLRWAKWVEHKQLLYTPRNTYHISTLTSLNSSQERRNHFRSRKTFFRFPPFFRFFNHQNFWKVVENSEYKSKTLSVTIQFMLIPWMKKISPIRVASFVFLSKRRPIKEKWKVSTREKIRRKFTAVSVGRCSL